MKARDAERLLREAGWALVRQKGSHRLWGLPTGERFTVVRHSHGGEDIDPAQARDVLAITQEPRRGVA